MNNGLGRVIRPSDSFKKVMFSKNIIRRNYGGNQ